MAKYSDEVVTEYLNSIVRKHRFKYKRARKLLPAKQKPKVLGSAGVSYASEKIDA